MGKKTSNAKTADQRPDLLVDKPNLLETVFELRDHLATAPNLYLRGSPAKVCMGGSTSPTITQLSRDNVIIETYKICRPVVQIPSGKPKTVTLPRQVANLYLSLEPSEWKLRPLVGLSFSPLLDADGTINASEGYYPNQRMYCTRIPPLSVKGQPSRADAEEALFLIRKTCRSFPFADASREREGAIEVVNLDHSPGHDESATLLALLTAICRTSLTHAPGFLVRAPEISGAGTGKGLLIRGVSQIAFGMQPEPFTGGESRNEFDKRIAAAMLKGAPILFVDNVNGRALRSDLLAQMLTEGPIVISRQLGAARMAQFYSTVFVAVTGNGVSLSEDLTRRFVVTELDARCEHPEQRDMPSGFLAGVKNLRSELLSAGLTIFRWGRQNPAELTRGRPLGSFEQWCDWVRDPLLTLGARDPVERIAAIKDRDPERLAIGERLAMWEKLHGTNQVKAAEVAEPIRKLISPHGCSRQLLVARLDRMLNVRVGGRVLTKQKASGHWTAAAYAVRHSD